MRACRSLYAEVLLLTLHCDLELNQLCVWPSRYKN